MSSVRHFRYNIDNAIAGKLINRLRYLTKHDSPGCGMPWKPDGLADNVICVVNL